MTEQPHESKIQPNIREMTMQNPTTNRYYYRYYYYGYRGPAAVGGAVGGA